MSQSISAAAGFADTRFNSRSPHLGRLGFSSERACEKALTDLARAVVMPRSILLVLSLQAICDIVIGSSGWAVLRQPPSIGEAGAIGGIGSWIFDMPETDKERTPTNQIRRSNRLLRRVIRRRRNRIAHIPGFFEINDRIAAQLRTLNLGDAVLDSLLTAYRNRRSPTMGKSVGKPRH